MSSVFSCVAVGSDVCELNTHEVKIDIEGHESDVTFLFVLVNSSSAQVEDWQRFTGNKSSTIDWKKVIYLQIKLLFCHQ